MLERYYIRPITVDRIRSSWITPAIEQYVGWLAEQRYSRKTVSRRIPLLVAFGEFAKVRGATQIAQLADHVEPFVQATFLGHVDVNSTAVYLTTTAALLEEANRRFEAFAAPTLREALHP